jgi:hypothetical protein
MLFHADLQDVAGPVIMPVLHIEEANTSEMSSVVPMSIFYNEQ